VLLRTWRTMYVAIATSTPSIIVDESRLKVKGQLTFSKKE
jgi:hypothetical protein